MLQHKKAKLKEPKQGLASFILVTIDHFASSEIQPAKKMVKWEISEYYTGGASNYNPCKCPSQPIGGFVVLDGALRLFGSVISAAFRCMINIPPNVYISV